MLYQLAAILENHSGAELENLQWLIIPDPDLRPCPILQHTGRILQRMWEGGDQRFVPVLPRFQEAALAVSGATPRDPIILKNSKKSPSNLINSIYVFLWFPIVFLLYFMVKGVSRGPPGAIRRHPGYFSADVVLQDTRKSVCQHLWIFKMLDTGLKFVMFVPSPPRTSYHFLSQDFQNHVFP